MKELGCAAIAFILMAGAVFGASGRKAAFDIMDTDSDGKLALEEFQAFFKPYFKVKDKNGDGLLDRTEFRNAGAFTFADTSKDGKVDLVEDRVLRTPHFGNLDKNRDGYLALAEYAVPSPLQPMPDTRWTYKEVDGKRLQLSVFLPDGYESGTRFPTIVIFHGGIWNAGDVSWHFPDCDYWSRRGMIAVSVDYRLRDRDGVNVPLECVKDAKSAIRFLRKNAKKLKVDPNKVVAAGGSAGGHLAMATATLTNEKINDESFDLSISAVPNAIVLWNPWFKCEESLSPPKHIVKALPPVITFAGGKDKGIPVGEMKAFHEQLKQAANTSRLYVGKNGKHGFCNGRSGENPFFYWSLDLTDAFLVQQGILTGRSIVEIPKGVARLKSDEYDLID
ncbi:MAG: alpha/beta hydrolase fold domain-containing protein [Phycisphaerae bacterium]|nr:alpha/beta hydrolase fold domain-containing protein [Phycisphaerae bacterium]